ncbi:glycogenin-1 isoform X2 [Lucilia sericata]|uniref:glycogenin-1 isoform X2 n=1 Tax=Lucilia sericata TaxID=13632 RepID=UPI0018A84F5E|nr:glycogenin-1 isoform X2 [Lucilia sericata]
MRGKLKDVYNLVQEVNIMDSQDSANLALLSRPELGITFTKLHCWRLVQFEKCVFLDSDTLVLQNCDELFEREEFSAAPDVSWPDCFNSGVFVYKPSQETFDKIVEFGLKNGSFDGGDQGLLNQYFADWATSDLKKRLPFLYNVTAYASYCYLPAFKQFRDKIKILHFAGKMKPWLIQFNSQSKMPCVPSDYSHAADLIQLWWNIFFDNVHQNLTDTMRYSLPNLMPWKSNYDNMAFELKRHYEQQHQQQHEIDTNLQYNLQYQHYQEHYTNKKIEFHDPWEDYYSKQEAKEEIQTNGDGYIQGYAENGNVNREWQGNDNNVQEYQMEQEYHYELQQQQQQHHHEHYQQQQVVEDSNKNFETESTISVDLERQSEVKEESSTSSKSCECEALAVTNRDDIENDNTEQDRKNTTTATLNNSQLSSIKTDSISPDNTTRCSSIESYSLQESNDNDNSTSSTENTVCEQKQEKVEEEAGLAGALSHLRLGEPRSPEQDAYEQLMRRQCWESGQVDYSGRDAFDNIWKKITQTLETKPDKTGDITTNNNNITKQHVTTKIVANVVTTKSQQISHKSGTTKQKMSRKLK